MHILRSLKSDLCHASEMFFLVSLAIALSFGHLSAKQPRITYIYDDLERLVRVITETGEAATYHNNAYS